jgi:hypothetical protein
MFDFMPDSAANSDWRSQSDAVARIVEQVKTLAKPPTTVKTTSSFVFLQQ